jgi:FtsP/CotA-like multicopper oxidase with cupredoxin domain
MTTLVMETGSRYDLIFDFSQFSAGSRIIMANRGGNNPFNGAIPNEVVPPQSAPADRYIYTDRIMAFDVLNTADPVGADDVNFTKFDADMNNLPRTDAVNRTRKVGLFEGRDQNGRLQPLLGTAEPATFFNDSAIKWPNDCFLSLPEFDGPYCRAGLAGRQMEGTMGWHSRTTENPALNDVEVWEIWNVSPDAHPIHLHSVHFELLGRHDIIYDSNANDTIRTTINGTATATDGICLTPQVVVEHTHDLGEGWRIVFPANQTDCNGVNGTCYNATAIIEKPEAYVEGATRMDSVTALPNQVTRIKAKFDRPGRYVWHCHILSHEDHEMMRVLQVGPFVDDRF